MGLDNFKTSERNVPQKPKDLSKTKEEVEQIIKSSNVTVKDIKRSSGSFACICICKNCGDTFRKGISRIERGDGKYCSSDCSAEGRSGQSMKDIEFIEPEIYRIAGLIYGDGHIRHIEDTGNYNVGLINTSLTLIDEFKESIERMGSKVNITTTTHKKEQHSDCYHAKASSIELYKKFNQEFKTPEDIKNNCTNTDARLNFVRGFYEAEGSIGDYKLRISQKEIDILEVIKMFLEEELNIDTTIREYNDEYHNLVISSQEDINKFVSETNPSIKRGDIDG